MPSESLGDCSGRVVVVAGGVLRSDSVRCGLSRIPDDAEIVLVHDGARPLAADGVFERVIEAVRAGADAAVPVIGVTDTIRWRGGGTADRSRLAAVQTPQAFRPDVLRAAHAGGADATDDAALAEAAGATVVTVDGDSRNLKITEAHDLVTAEALLLGGRADRRTNRDHTGEAVGSVAGGWAARERSEPERETPPGDARASHLSESPLKASQMQAGDGVGHG